MPEGDTIFRAAQTMHRALAGHAVVRFESVLPALERVDHDRPIAGRTIDSVASRGKHLLMTFSGDLILHTHMRMNGSWHLYRPTERWQRARRDMRIVLATASFVAVGFDVPVAEFITARDLLRHKTLAELGPDLLDGDFDRLEAMRRMRSRAGETVGDVLLDQRVLSGIGNVFKSEILFAAGIDPFGLVGDLPDADLERIIDLARKQLGANVLHRSQTLSPIAGRRTTGSLDPSAKLWVYGRGGRPCRRCGVPIQARKGGPDARLTYWCPRCQPGSAASRALSVRSR